MTTKKFYGPWTKWHHKGGSVDIVKYRTVTEQAEQDDLKAAEQLLRENGYTITPPSKPLTFEDVVPITEAPPIGAKYWVVYAGIDSGVYEAVFLDGQLDNMIIQHRMAYTDKEHALIAAKHIFGLKGGEL